MFYVGGELDLSSTAAFTEVIGEAVARGGLLTIDVSALRFIDGAGMRVIQQALDEMPSGCILVHGVSRTFERLAEIMGIRTAPRLHLQPCGEDPFPRGRLASSSADIAERFEGLRELHRSLTLQTRTTTARARSLVQGTRRTRSLLAERRAA